MRGRLGAASHHRPPAGLSGRPPPIGIHGCRAPGHPLDRRVWSPEADEVALKQIHQPLRIEAHLAPEDPRRVDLERRALSKLRRVMPRVQVDYVSATSIGLFEQTSAHYGEIWYEIGGHRSM